MAFLEPKLNLKITQSTVLTPAMMQMVSLLALNKLELSEMIQNELVQNPVLEEGTEIVEGTEVAAESSGSRDDDGTHRFILAPCSAKTCPGPA